MRIWNKERLVQGCEREDLVSRMLFPQSPRVGVGVADLTENFT